MEHEHHILYNTTIGWSYHVTVTVTRSCDTEKVIEDSRTNDIIQHSKSMLAL